MRGYKGTAGKQEHWVQRDVGTTGIEKNRVQRNSGFTGTVGTEEPWVQGNSGYIRTMGTGEQRNIGYRGTEGQWVQRNNVYKGIVGTEAQRNTGHSGTADKANTKVVIYRIRAHQKNLPILQLKCRIKSELRPCIEQFRNYFSPTHFSVTHSLTTVFVDTRPS